MTDTTHSAACPAAPSGDELQRLDRRLIDEPALILSNVQVGPCLYEMELEAPLITERLLPGQFVHMRIPSMGSHLLRRPFSVYDRDLKQGRLTILYQVVGAGTEHMSALSAGELASLIGPVGRSWRELSAGMRCLCVAGGVGAAPLFLYAREQSAAQVSIDVVLGAQSRASLVALPRYEAIQNGELICATDDGSFGVSGFCTIPAFELIDAHDYDLVLCCGPEALMRQVAARCAERGLPCQISLERRMGCGVGACLSCVVQTLDGLKRSCVDGPVFDAEEVIWS